jgi:hypothetical protein
MRHSDPELSHSRSGDRAHGRGCENSTFPEPPVRSFPAAAAEAFRGAFRLLKPSSSREEDAAEFSSLFFKL